LVLVELLQDAVAVEVASPVTVIKLLVVGMKNGHENHKMTLFGPKLCLFRAVTPFLTSKYPTRDEGSRRVSQSIQQHAKESVQFEATATAASYKDLVDESVRR
jgi:hypothetical protein